MKKLTDTATKIKAKLPFDELFKELYSEKFKGKMSLCPFHDDHEPSFAVYRDYGKCFAGCKPPGNNKGAFDIFSLLMQAYGVDFKTARQELAERARVDIDEPKKPRATKHTDEYDYMDEQRTLLFQSLRYPPDEQHKRKYFRQRRPDGKGGWIWNLDDTRRVLFGLPELQEAPLDDPVLIPEGEKDVLTARKLRFVATCNPEGADKWPRLCKDWKIHEPLKERIVWIIPDNDEPGRRHAEDIATSLVGFAKFVKIVKLPGLSHKGDLTDFVEQHGPEEARRLLLEIVAATDEYVPSTQPQDGLTAHVVSKDDPHLTDLGNAQRLASCHGDKIRFCKSLDWLTYDGKRWSADDTSRVQHFAKNTVRQMYQEAGQVVDEDRRKALVSHAIRSESASRIAAMITLLPSEPTISVVAEVFDRDKMHLNVANGTLDLRTGERRPHSAADMIMKLAPVEYDPAAKAPRWLQFLHEIMDGDQELVSFLQRLFGYSLTGDTREQVWAFLWGKGSNGKGVLIDTISFVLGDYAVNTPAETFLETQGSSIRNDLARLRGARFIAASEPSGGRFDAAALKTLTGQDPITARYLHREYFQFYPEGKLFFSANQRPTVRDMSYGFWRRVLMIPFLRIFKKEPDASRNEQRKDDSLRDSLKPEAAGILNWMVEGCLQWQAQGLNPPAKVRAAVEQYKHETDILAEFIDTQCCLGMDKSVPVGDFYPLYQRYCEDHSIKKPLSKQKFNEDLLARPGITKDQVGKARTHTWFGIGLRKAEAQGNVVKGDFEKGKAGWTCGECDVPPLACPMPEEQRNAKTCSHYQPM